MPINPFSQDEYAVVNLIKNLKQAHSEFEIRTLSKKRRSRRRGGQQENFHSDGIEAGRISIVEPPRLPDRLILLKVPIIKADPRRSQRDHYDSISRYIEIPTGKIVYIKNHTQPFKVETSRFIQNFGCPYIVHSHCFNRPDLLILQDPTANGLLKPINIEKIVVAPETQDILDQPDYDIDILPPEPTQISTVPDLKEIASELANYLLQQPNYSAYSSEACANVYTKFFPLLENFLIVMEVYVALLPMSVFIS